MAESASRFLFATRSVPGAAGEFVAITSDPGVIRLARAQLELPEAERTLHINGPIAHGNGDHNLKWSWHFVPDEWDLVESSMELCDGTPQMVEDDPDHWVDSVTQFCPWESYIVREVERQ